MKTALFALILSLIITLISGKIIIPLLKRIKASQTVLKYVEVHKEKNGTATMGGVFFILSAAVVFFIFGGGKFRLALVALTIGMAFLCVGFIDDFIKIKFKRNEGLKAYQKIIFQLSIATVAGVFCYINGISEFNIPFANTKSNLGIWTIPIVIIIFIAITNSVNLTDGLDGLAGSVSAVYLVFIAIIIYLQSSYVSDNVKKEYENIILLCACLIGGIFGFLVFNVNKAKVFMGDTGSLALGGFIGAISIFSANAFFIVIIGIMFTLSSISVILQVIYYKHKRKRIFLMAPLHHHFQLKGYTESQIAYFYSLVTAVMGIVCVLFVI